eukprot:614668-Prorocentrum_minimum.AAC.1
MGGGGRCLRPVRAVIDAINDVCKGALLPVQASSPLRVRRRNVITFVINAPSVVWGVVCTLAVTGTRGP